MVLMVVHLPAHNVPRALPPLIWQVRPSRMLADTFPVAYEPKHGARIGLKPRHGGPESAVWGEVPRCARDAPQMHPSPTT